MTVRIGTQLGTYEILSTLGKGAMGEVYLARDSKLRRQVALKVLPSELAADPDRLRRMEQEAFTASGLNHPNIVQIYDIGQSEGTSYIVMELVEGTTLRELLDAGPMSFERAGPIARQLAEGLAKAHAAGVVHRDLKPDNLMVTVDGYVKILDFGLAKQFEIGPRGNDAETLVSPPKGTWTTPGTTPGTMLGTLGYMAPEQARGQAADQRADQFSLGVVLYEMTAGEAPFRRSTPVDTLAALLEHEPPSLAELRPELPEAFCAVVTRCLSKAPEDRYDETAEVVAKLGVALEPGSVPSGLAALAEQQGDKHGQSPARPALAAREKEMEQLRSMVESAMQGRGRLVMIGGEPGVGKTRLVQELIHEARANGFLSLAGHCSELEGAPAFAPWIEILEAVVAISPRDTLRTLLGEAAPEIAKLLPELHRVFPDLPEPLDLPPAEGRRLLFSGFRGFVERSSELQPLLLILEDLHWSDQASLLLLQNLAPATGQLPILIVGTYRDVELDVARPLADALRQLVRERFAERLSLRRLPESGTAALVFVLCGQRPSPALTERLHRETEGNAFFLEEVVEHLREEGRLFDDQGQLQPSLDLDDLEVPESVRLVVGRRLERLDDASQEVLTIAAVLGRRFDFGLLQEVHGGDTEVVLDALENAERLKLVMNETSRRRARFAFAHELIRHTLTSTLTLPRRQRLHRRCAEALERSHADRPEEVASALAHHLYQSGGFADDAKTRHFLVEAGRQALSSMAFEEALDNFARTDDLEDVSADGAQVTAESAELGLLRSEALKGLGRFAEVVAESSRVLPYYEQTSDEVVVAEICREGSYFLGWNANPTAGLEMVERGLRMATGVSSHRCRLLAIGGLVASFGGNRQRGEEYFAEAKSIARQLNDTYLEGDRLAWEIWYCAFYMLTDDARDRAQAAIDRLAENERFFDLNFLLGILSVVHGMAGDFDRLDEVVAKHQRIAERLGGFTSFHIQQGRSRAAWCRLGDLAQREEDAGVLREITQRMGVPWLQDHLVPVALVRFCQGRWADARSLAEEAYRHDARIVDSPLRGSGLGALMLINSYLANSNGDGDGSRAEADRLIDEALQDLPSSGEPNPQCCWFTLFPLVESLSLLGYRDRAAELYPLCVEALQTGTVVDWWGRVLLQRIAGIAATCAGEWQSAQEHFETALLQAHELPFLSEQPEVRWWFSKMLSQRSQPGDSDRAATLLREAASGYQELGMPRHVAMIEAKLGEA